MADDFKACDVDGCNRNAHWRVQGRRGFCAPHYKRWWRYGDPLEGGTDQGEPLRWLREVAMPFDGDECLIWPFARSVDGYARVTIDGEKRQVSRVICEEVNGVPPSPNHEAAHSCAKGHLGCVTKGHLSWKTKVGNEADKLIHGTIARGERNGLSKLTEEDVREIRLLTETLSQQKIAHRFGVSQTTIGFVLRRETWGWMD